MSVPAQVLRTIPAPVRELGSGPPFPAGGGPSAASSGGGEPDWRSLFERERRRAEELRRGEIGWRAKAREALSLRAEVGRLKRLLAAAGVDARKRSTIVSPRMEVETRRTRIGELEAELAKLRASRAVHAKGRRFGRKSERRSGRGRTVRAANRPAPPAMVARPGRVSKSARKFTTPRRTSASARIAGNRMWRTAPTRRN